MIRPYRGKAINTGEWVKGDLIQWDNRRFIFFMPDYSNLQWLKDEIFNAETLIEVLPDSVGQYTGRKDKNGVKVYGGDDVDVSMSFEGGTLPHRGYIVYDNEFGAFGTKNDAGVTLLHNHCLHTLKVIGNIHTNPELLEGDSK